MINETYTDPIDNPLGYIAHDALEDIKAGKNVSYNAMCSHHKLNTTIKRKRFCEQIKKLYLTKHNINIDVDIVKVKSELKIIVKYISG